jgi:hypothetical protein
MVTEKKVQLKDRRLKTQTLKRITRGSNKELIQPIQWGMLQRTMLQRTVYINKIRMLQRT